MSEDLQNEVQAINSIYSPETLIAETPLHNDNYILNIPNHSVAVRLQFPQDYPLSRPTVLGTQHVGRDVNKGAGTRVAEIVREVLAEVSQAGEVCLFDMLEAVGTVLSSETDAATGDGQVAEGNQDGGKDTVNFETQHSCQGSAGESPEQRPLGTAPPWIISEAVTEKKSVFLARVAPVSTPVQAKQFLRHLLCTDKKVVKATHNITAWRIKGEGNTTFQDCDDDGETAAGARLLHLMQVMDLWNVMVIVTRWYGGVKLGPDRFRIISSVARDAFVRGGFVRNERDRPRGAKRKGKK